MLAYRHRAFHELNWLLIMGLGHGCWVRVNYNPLVFVCVPPMFFYVWCEQKQIFFLWEPSQICMCVCISAKVLYKPYFMVRLKPCHTPTCSYFSVWSQLWLLLSSANYCSGVTSSNHHRFVFLKLRIKIFCIWFTNLNNSVYQKKKKKLTKRFRPFFKL